MRGCGAGILPEPVPRSVPAHALGLCVSAGPGRHGPPWVASHILVPELSGLMETLEAGGVFAPGL